MAYKLGSLFDGSGGFPLAGSLCGIEPKWAAEVEPYPIAVTRSRFPNMRHLGDISKVNGGEIEPVDIITFGSPCQDLSVAGKRAGLKHESNGDEETTRSGLFMEAVRIIKEMREATNGVYPRFALWENVPGAFSSNRGEDFRTVLAELIAIVEPDAVMPPVSKAGWAYADSYCGDGWSLAYRVFDAQHWGVTQRRRRIHLVVDFRGECAQDVLFEHEGVRGDFAQGRTPWQGIAPNAENCSGADDRAGEGEGTGGRPADVVYAIDQQGGKGGANYAENVMPTLCSDSHGTPHGVACTLKIRSGCEGGGKGWKEDSFYTLNTIDRPAVAYCIGNGQLNQMSMAEQSNTLDCMHDQQAVLVFDKETYNSGVNATGGHYIAEGGPAPTLRTMHPPGVVVQYIVRRLTPTECARLQGFPDTWGHPDKLDSLSPEEYRFWLEVRNTHAAINGKQIKEYTEAQMLKWYNGLHTDSAEYKMWGNGIALPPALYCLQGIADALNREDEDNVYD